MPVVTLNPLQATALRESVVQHEYLPQIDLVQGIINQVEIDFPSLASARAIMDDCERTFDQLGWESEITRDKPIETDSSELLALARNALEREANELHELAEGVIHEESGLAALRTQHEKVGALVALLEQADEPDWIEDREVDLTDEPDADDNEPDEDEDEDERELDAEPEAADEEDERQYEGEPAPVRAESGLEREPEAASGPGAASDERDDERAQGDKPAQGDQPEAERFAPAIATDRY
jgi:hypothetical protein